MLHKLNSEKMGMVSFQVKIRREARVRDPRKLEFFGYGFVADTIGLLSVTLTRVAPQVTVMTRNGGHTPFKVIQGHHLQYQSKARMWLPISK